MDAFPPPAPYEVVDFDEPEVEIGDLLPPLLLLPAPFPPLPLLLPPSLLLPPFPPPPPLRRKSFFKDLLREDMKGTNMTSLGRDGSSGTFKFKFSGRKTQPSKIPDSAIY